MRNVLIKAADPGQVNTWKDKMALGISAVLSPFVIIPIFIFIICFAFSNGIRELLLYFSICIFFSTIVPLINVWIMMKMGKISDIHVAQLTQRKEPFVVGLSSIFIGTGILYMIKAPREIIILGIVMFINGLLFFIISLFWKISMHLSIMAGVTTSLMLLVNINYVAAFSLLPILMWARIHRKRHNFYQGVIAIFLAVLGLVVTFKLLGYPKY